MRHQNLVSPGTVGLAVLLLALTGCDATNDEVAPGTITVTLTHAVGGRGLVLNAMDYATASGTVYEVTRLEYVITDLALQRADGGRVDLVDSHYSNVEEQNAGAVGTIEVPDGTYTGLSFTFGVAGTENVFGALPNTAAYNNMLWPAQLGGGTDRYHYMRLEGRYQRDDGSLAGFLTHTGPSGGNDYAFAVSLPLQFEAAGNHTAIEVTMDVNEWFANPTPYNFADYAGMIMGNQQAQAILKANGASVFSVTRASAQ